MITSKNTLTFELRLDIDLVGTELGKRIIQEFRTLENVWFPMVESGIEKAYSPTAYEYYLNCVNEPQKKIDAVMDNIAKMLETRLDNNDKS